MVWKAINQEPTRNNRERAKLQREKQLAPVPSITLHERIFVTNRFVAFVLPHTTSKCRIESLFPDIFCAQTVRALAGQNKRVTHTRQHASSTGAVHRPASNRSPCEQAASCIGRRPSGHPNRESEFRSFRCLSSHSGRENKRNRVWVLTLKFPLQLNNMYSARALECHSWSWRRSIIHSTCQSPRAACEPISAPP